MACKHSRFERKTEASLLSRAADLDHDLQERYASERLISPSTSGTPTHGAPYGTAQQETPSLSVRIDLHASFTVFASGQHTAGAA
jgi:hypothetical protein